MTINPDDKRSLIISSATEAELRRGLERIPGYVVEPLEEELRRSMGLTAGGDERFYLRSTEGERIVVRHRAGEATAGTVNVVNQDALGSSVPIHADEVVKLHHAIRNVDGLHSSVLAAEIDLVAPDDSGAG